MRDADRSSKSRSILEQYSDLLKERDETRTRIRMIENKLDRINREGNVRDAVKGGLGNEQTFYIEGFPVADEDELKYQLNKQKRILSERESNIRDKLEAVEAWLNDLDDSRMRRLITKRYIENKTWYQVAIEMGKNYTEFSCRKQVERFIAQIHDSEHTKK